ncbi:hypothetical protein AKJ45_03215 [candidate division MSBL1 archaeon SCGC-AAA261F19]|uniref:Uncharacterized protein n=1 Tax=candidate division MSBL1 archaeon SCGC-AAA261F19 TaxID=1698275 RepID=A0A133V8U6_9EURY|nr:hypothetical protein AKJ45_03215 [candidate division MSBL1 archaeon SCGC-AAA261F19]
MSDDSTKKPIARVGGGAPPVPRKKGETYSEALEREMGKKKAEEITEGKEFKTWKEAKRELKKEAPEPSPGREGGLAIPRPVTPARFGKPYKRGPELPRKLVGDVSHIPYSAIQEMPRKHQFEALRSKFVGGAITEAGYGRLSALAKGQQPGWEKYQSYVKARREGIGSLTRKELGDLWKVAGSTKASGVTFPEWKRARRFYKLEKGGLIKRVGDRYILSKGLSQYTPGQIERLQAAGFDLTKKDYRQAKALRKGLDKGLFRRTAGGKFMLTKGRHNLTESEKKLAKSAGFDVSRKKQGWFETFLFGSRTFREKSSALTVAPVTPEQYGSVITAPQRVKEAFSFMPGKSEEVLVGATKAYSGAITAPISMTGIPPKLPEGAKPPKRGLPFTAGRMVGYYAIGKGAGKAVGAGAGFLGAGAKAAYQAAPSTKALAATAPKAAKALKYTTWPLKKGFGFFAGHPRLTTALLWSPAAAAEGLKIYGLHKAGAKPKEIVRKVGPELAFLGGFYGGFKGGAKKGSEYFKRIQSRLIGPKYGVSYKRMGLGRSIRARAQTKQISPKVRELMERAAHGDVGAQQKLMEMGYGPSITQVWGEATTPKLQRLALKRAGFKEPVDIQKLALKRFLKQKYAISYAPLYKQTSPAFKQQKLDLSSKTRQISKVLQKQKQRLANFLKYRTGRRISAKEIQEAKEEQLAAIKQKTKQKQKLALALKQSLASAQRVAQKQKSGMVPIVAAIPSLAAAQKTAQKTAQRSVQALRLQLAPLGYGRPPSKPPRGWGIPPLLGGRRKPPKEPEKRRLPPWLYGERRHPLGNILELAFGKGKAPKVPDFGFEFKNYLKGGK